MPIIETSRQIDGEKVRINIEMEGSSSSTPYGEVRGAKETVVQSGG